MKREKRKQANRESARRSRLRKQAEYEELVKTCESLNAEKMALQSKIENLKGDSETLRLENAALRVLLNVLIEFLELLVCSQLFFMCTKLSRFLFFLGLIFICFFSKRILKDQQYK